MNKKKVLRAKITGQGKGLPRKVLNNFDLEKMVETSDEWIRTRTGISERRILEERESYKGLSREAAHSALQKAGLAAKELDLIIVATFTADTPLPSAACALQHLIGAKNAAAFDINAACSGYLYGLTMANAFISSGKFERVLVLGMEVLSRFTDWQDRNTCVLFGDAAGASVLEPSYGDEGIIATYIASQGEEGTTSDLLYIQPRTTQQPFDLQAGNTHQHCIHMRGNELFKIAVKSMASASHKVLKMARMSVDQVDVVITHQANLRIINAYAERMGVPPEKVYNTIHKYGNTSAATIPVTMYDAMQDKRLNKGDLGLFASFGGGLTWGAALIRF